MPQSTSAVLMVAPKGFRPDDQTADDNAFQTTATEDEIGDIQARAEEEFSRVTQSLEQAGIQVTAFEGRGDLPDAVFPNNWFSTHEDGTLVLYPMKAASRRPERRPEIVDWLMQRYPGVVDMTGWEERERYLEGTGSMVLDRTNKLCFAARSLRTDEQLVRNWCADLDYEPILFDSEGPGGKPVYHTNVLLALGATFAVVCTEAILSPSPVLSALLSTDREIIEITKSQMASYCGNVLELEGHGRSVVMSTTAHSALQSTQLDRLKAHADLIIADIPTIERYGGGGVRCMIAELF